MTGRPQPRQPSSIPLLFLQGAGWAYAAQSALASVAAIAGKRRSASTIGGRGAPGRALFAILNILVLVVRTPPPAAYDVRLALHGTYHTHASTVDIIQLIELNPVACPVRIVKSSTPPAQGHWQCTDAVTLRSLALQWQCSHSSGPLAVLPPSACPHGVHPSQLLGLKSLEQLWLVDVRLSAGHCSWRWS